MTTPNTTANISPLPSGDYIFRVAGLNSVGQGTYSTIYTAMPVPDPNFGNVSLLMHMDGTAGSFVDSSSYNHTITAVGDAAQSSTQSKFGGLSAYFDGSGDYLTADSSSFAFGTGDFTVEAWVYSTDVSSSTQKGWIQTSNQSGGLSTSYTTGIIVNYNNGGLRVNVAGTDISSAASIINTNQWYHIAACRQSGIVRIFVNGNLAASGTAAGNCSGQYLCVGGYYDTNYLLSGYIDELRITKGIARYTSNFTPSPVPFPVSPIITISSQPSDQFTADGNATFSVTASVSPGATLSYQWQKKTGNLPFSDISGATNSTLSLSSLTESNNNELYRCIIRSTGGVNTTTNTIKLITIPVMVEALVIAGGGGGGTGYGGAGGAGGYLQSSSFGLEAGIQYIVTVGAGGAGSSSYSSRGTNGVGSSLSSFVSIGGGGGGSESAASGANGGCGGGGALTANGGQGTSNQGFAGGSGSDPASSSATGGGGGGAGAVGEDANSFAAGNGGVGLSSSITGTAVVRAGGGGGGCGANSSNTPGNGGEGGGGSGGSFYASINSTPGSTNSGSGGGGGGLNPYNGAAGGSGVVIIRSAQTATSTTGSPTVTTVGNDTVYTFTGSGSITF